jgi:ribonuclease HI
MCQEGNPEGRISLMARPKYYVVWKGRRTGIFASWEDCSASVTGFPGAQYKAFDSRAAAEAALRKPYRDYQGKPASVQKWLFSVSKPLLPSLCVDAACDGSPGTLEYRGVETETGRQVFHAGPYAEGTNNVGEFLAIVRGLLWVQEESRGMPVYSDSETAIGWVRAGKCRTQLARTESNEALFGLIAEAERWLARRAAGGTRRDTMLFLKWDTGAWGENPADFGRK